jgi:hypothetical protein
LGGQVCDTFTASQGHTIHGDVAIDLGGLTSTATEKACWTALTRATGNIYLVMGPSMKKDTSIESCFSSSQILTAMLALASVRQQPVLTAAVDVDGIVRSAVLSHLARCLSPRAAARLGLGAPNPVVGASRGVSAQYRQPWLATPTVSPDLYTARTHRAQMTQSAGVGPAFSAHRPQYQNNPVDVAHEIRHLAAMPGDASLVVASTSYALPPIPVMEVQPDPALDVNEPTDDALREVVVHANANATFQHIVDGPPDALHHVRADRLTTKLGEEKRIRVGRHTAPWTRADGLRLHQLKRGFRKAFDVNKWQRLGFNPALFEEAERTKIASWASKRTGRAIQASVAKQNLDAHPNHTSLFPKGQFVKKKPKWRGHAFPCQTVSDFNLGKIFRDASYATYLEHRTMECAFETTYVHFKASPDDLSAWYRKHWRPGVMTANDYTAWDSGIDHVFLAFDLWLCELCGFPSEYIEKLRFDRLNTISHLGPHMPRQESGDRFTFTLNTLRNAALTCASLDCPARTPIAVAGDDSVVLGAWRKPSNFTPGNWLMTPKREEARITEFCGMLFGEADVRLDPSILRWRAAFGMQLGRSDQDYWRSISDAIRDCASRSSRPSPYLSNAATICNRAVLLFNLDRALLMPTFPCTAITAIPPRNVRAHTRTSAFCTQLFAPLL